MTDYTDRDLVALDQIEDLLTAYAEARLSAATPVLARIRAAIVAQAAARTADADTQRYQDTDRVTRRQWAMPRFRLPRRALAFGLAATLTVGGTAAVLAATPDSALYGARVALDNALRPFSPDARLAAHEDRIAEVLAIAQAAAAKGDTYALDVALTAYQNEVDAAIAELGDDPDRLARLETELGKHVAVLEGLQATLPAEAAIEHAIVASQKAVDRLRATSGHPADHPTPPPHPTHVPATDGPDNNNGRGNH